MKNSIVLLASVLYFGGAPAMAADSGLYFDVSLGKAIVKGVKKSDFDAAVIASGFTPSTSTFDDNGSYWSAEVGYKIFSYFAAGLGWMDLGDAKYRATGTLVGVPLKYKATLSSGGPAVTAIGILPLGSKFELQGRAGILFAKTLLTEYVETSFGSDSVSTDDKSQSLFLGVGATFNVTDTFAIRLGALRFNDVGDKTTVGKADVDVFNVGLTFRQ